VSAARTIVLSAAIISGSVAVVAQITNGPAPDWRSNPPVSLPQNTNQFLLQPKPETPRPPGLEDAIELRPGIYLTKPYTSMVKVPGAHPDDMIQRPPRLPEPPMRIIRPDLKTVPLGSGRSERQKNLPTTLPQPGADEMQKNRFPFSIETNKFSSP
jgi:hypothetical protein